MTDRGLTTWLDRVRERWPEPATLDVLDDDGDIITSLSVDASTSELAGSILEANGSLVVARDNGGQRVGSYALKKQAGKPRSKTRRRDLLASLMAHNIATNRQLLEQSAQSVGVCTALVNMMGSLTSHYGRMAISDANEREALVQQQYEHGRAMAEVENERARNQRLDRALEIVEHQLAPRLFGFLGPGRPSVDESQPVDGLREEILGITRRLYTHEQCGPIVRQYLPDQSLLSGIAITGEILTEKELRTAILKVWDELSGEDINKLHDLLATEPEFGQQVSQLFIRLNEKDNGDG